MKGYPSNFNTKEDYYNCLSMVQAGDLEAAGLKSAIDALEERRYIHTAILSKSADKKEISIMSCPEIAIGAPFYCGDTTGTIKSAVSIHSTDKDRADTMALTLSTAIPETETKIHIISSVDVLVSLGMNEDDIKAIKGVLKQYE